MKKAIKHKNLFCFPGTQTILGTHFEGKPNFMALGWLTRANFNPPMLGICVNKNTASHAAILETGEFSINTPSEKMVELTDYIGLVSGRSIDKSSLFDLFYGELKSAPMIRECPITMECSVAETVNLPTNYFFIGEIINIYSEEKFLTNGKPDIKKINPFLLTMPDNNFWAIGECVGKPWDAGKALQKRLKQEKEK
jgi:flavin reductase (DIM6/NTAB) family NADH-FMN oxidoreductase RutF